MFFLDSDRMLISFVVVILEVSACSLWSVASLVVSGPSLKQNTMVTGACGGDAEYRQYREEPR